MIFAENIFSQTSPKIPNRLQNIPAGYMRRSDPKTKAAEAAEGPGTRPSQQYLI